MRPLVLGLVLFSSATLADAPGYELLLGAEVRDGTLKVAPIISAPAGVRLRYEVTTTRAGRSGNSNSRQSGKVTVGNDGKASLSRVAVNVSPQGRYQVHVEVYDAARLVASDTLRHPE